MSSLLHYICYVLLVDNIQATITLNVPVYDGVSDRTRQTHIDYTTFALDSAIHDQIVPYAVALANSQPGIDEFDFEFPLDENEFDFGSTQRKSSNYNAAVYEGMSERTYDAREHDNTQPGIDDVDFAFPFDENEFEFGSTLKTERSGNSEDSASEPKQELIHVNVIPLQMPDNRKHTDTQLYAGLMDYFKGLFGNEANWAEDLEMVSRLKKRRRRRSIGDAIVAALHLCEIHPKLLNVSVQGIQFHCKIIRKY